MAISVLFLVLSEGVEIQPMAVFPRSEGFAAFHIDSLRPVLLHSYAMTVHKAQGSEFDRVALILPDRDLPINTAEILYTALTRSRSSVVIIGSREILETGITRKIVRNCGIIEKLLNICPEAESSRQYLTECDRWTSEAMPGESEPGDDQHKPDSSYNPYRRSLGGCTPTKISPAHPARLTTASGRYQRRDPGAHGRPGPSVCPSAQCGRKHVRDVQKDGANCSDRCVNRRVQCKQNRRHRHHPDRNSR